MSVLNIRGDPSHAHVTYLPFLYCLAKCLACLIWLHIVEPAGIKKSWFQPTVFNALRHYPGLPTCSFDLHNLDSFHCCIIFCVQFHIFNHQIHMFSKHWNFNKHEGRANNCKKEHADQSFPDFSDFFRIALLQHAGQTTLHVLCQRVSLCKRAISHNTRTYKTFFLWTASQVFPATQSFWKYYWNSLENTLSGVLL